jgi:3D (Asp-Asp-Asp) domain-containing protein
MEIVLEDPSLKIKKILAIIAFINILAVLFGRGLLTKAGISQKNSKNIIDSTLSVVQGNSIASVSDPALPVRVRKIKMVVTAYSSDPWQTDDSPLITASGAKVKDGVVANNLLPFGTKIKIPEIYGDKIFVVKDRMSWKKSYYHLDIWFPDYRQAKNFGAKRVYVEILES